VLPGYKIPTLPTATSSSKLFSVLTNLQDDGDAEEWDHCATLLRNLLRAQKPFIRETTESSNALSFRCNSLDFTLCRRNFLQFTDLNSFNDPSSCKRAKVSFRNCSGALYGFLIALEVTTAAAEDVYCRVKWEDSHKCLRILMVVDEVCLMIEYIRVENWFFCIRAISQTNAERGDLTFMRIFILYQAIKSLRLISTF
jgi:hypothetical protein